MNGAGLRLVVRADATPTLGAGHAMRAVTLAAAWMRAGGEAALTGRVTLRLVRQRIEALGIPLLERLPFDIDVAVVDSTDPDVRRSVATSVGARLRMLVDDVGGAVDRGFDAVWSPLPFATGDMYPGFAGTVLSGADVVPVRDGVPRWCPDAAGETLVILGGGRPPGAVADAMIRLARLLPEHRFASAGWPGPPGWRRIPADALWRHARGAARLVTDAGTTVWEAAASGIPVVMIELHESQRRVYRWGRDAGVPGVSALVADLDHLARRLRRLLELARPLPRLTDGTGRLVAWVAGALEQRTAV